MEGKGPTSKAKATKGEGRVSPQTLKPNFAHVCSHITVALDSYSFTW